MYIKTVDLHKYRNYDSLHIELSDGCNIFYGKNAQGKTNIIEAIFLCAVGRSHRTPKDVELIKIEEDIYRVDLDVSKTGEDTNISVCFDNQVGKKYKVNEIPLKRTSELIGNINAVIFSPEEIMMIKQGPSERRRFTNMTISQIKPLYYKTLQKYLHVVKQRNAILKKMFLGMEDGKELMVWNDVLASVGAQIMAERRDFVKRMSVKLTNNHMKLSDGKEKLEIVYRPSFNIDDCNSTAEIKKKFIKVLEESATREKQRAMTLFGPQRDDYEFIINGISLKHYGSQGQQRTAILALKISEVEIMHEETDEMPVLLLDDVKSELDENRQEILFNTIKNIQTIITCTEKETFNYDGNTKVFHVDNGTIISEE